MVPPALLARSQPDWVAHHSFERERGTRDQLTSLPKRSAVPRHFHDHLKNVDCGAPVFGRLGHVAGLEVIGSGTAWMSFNSCPRRRTWTSIPIAIGR